MTKSLVCVTMGIFLIAVPAFIPGGTEPACASPVIITGKQDIYEIGANLEVLADPQGRLTIADVSSPIMSERFRQCTVKVPNYGFTRSAYWFRFTIADHSPSPEKYFLVINWPLFDRIDFYTAGSDGKWTARTAGDALSFSSREIKNRNFVFSLPDISSDPETVYLRVSAEDSVQLPIKIMTVTAFYSWDKRTSYLLGLYFGILIVITLYSFIIFLSIRDSAYFFYILFLSGFILFELSYQGIGFEILWDVSPGWQNHSLPFAMGLFYFLILQFTRSFLKTRESLPVMNSLLLAHMGVSLVFIISSLFTSPMVNLIVLNLWGVLGANLVVLAAFLALRNGYRAARFYLIAWITYLIGGGLIALKNSGLIPSNLITSYTFQVGSVAGSVLFSLALTDRINLNRLEKEEAQRSLIRHQKESLEYQVSMTTAFARFVPQEFLRYLNRESIVDVQLGDQALGEMAVLFSDIRSFTSLSESMEPQENFNFLNSYLSRIGPIIREHRGFIDKYIGDAIMALFPEKAEDSIYSAVMMQRAVHEYNFQRKKAEYPPVFIGIGIHRGNLMLGTIGEENRMETTVISDAVNLASRMEGLTKLYGAGIIISGQTLKSITDPSAFHYRHLGLVRIKGKKVPVAVIEILDGLPARDFDLKMATGNDFAASLQLIREKKYAEALNILHGIAARNPDDKAVALYRQKCGEWLGKR